MLLYSFSFKLRKIKGVFIQLFKEYSCNNSILQRLKLEIV